MNVFDHFGRWMGIDMSDPAEKNNDWEVWKPDVDESLPKDVYNAMVRTQRIDYERKLEAEDERLRQMSMYGTSLAAARYSAHTPGIGDTASQIRMRQQMFQAGIGQASDNAALWSNKLLEDYMKLNPQILINPQETIMNSTGIAVNHGMVRINFPFGQVEMDIRNEAELDRMVSIAKHMLKIHEENEATAAIRRNAGAKTPARAAVNALSTPSFKVSPPLT